MAQATIGNSEFDRDTAIRPRVPGEGDGGAPGTAAYDVELSEGWTILGAVNGGYLLSVLGRALGAALPHPDPFTITAHYLTTSRSGPAVVRTQVVRTGRRLSTGQAGLFQFAEDGTEVERIRVLATYGDLGALTDDVRTTAKPPAMPPLEHCLGSDSVPPHLVSELTGRLDLRLDPATANWIEGEPSGRGETRGWFALADGRPADALSLLLAVDALPPTTFEMGLPGWVPTVELTAHIRRRPAAGPLRVTVTTRNLAGGYLEEDVEVWDAEDRLVAQARQLAVTPRG
ncbi:thioesterase family protein [Streptomyces sp. HU2014]|uniref:thioesterase family protein n=1 Tax=Streptomyces sp. HU2014 TaxID=2939414 RepID=UPI0020105C87|nr:thioesterase family protein [Streptomyces sp. HU2014]UQI47753.1 thioesterase family protein [Streptomyces sp. HU2014]